MSHRVPGDVTRQLLAWSGGEKAALGRLLPLVYEELRRRAETHMRGERAPHTLQPTELVHEAYLKLVAGAGVAWSDRAHFFAVASRAMRQVLVDHARRRGTARRRRAEVSLPHDDAAFATPAPSLDILAFDLALDRLARLDARQSRLVEMRVFAGLTIGEAAEVLGCSHATVSRDWKHAEAWLHREMASP